VPQHEARAMDEGGREMTRSLANARD